jgi:hypothetical protein
MTSWHKENITQNFLCMMAKNRDDITVSKYVVTRRPIAKQQLCRQATVQQQSLGNNYVDIMLPRQRQNKQ